MNETPKNPCLTCDHRHKDKKREEPCASCPKPWQYDEALKKTFFPSVKFLRNSTPDNWGVKKEDKTIPILDAKIPPNEILKKYYKGRL